MSANLRQKAAHLQAQADALFAEGKHEQALKLYAAAEEYRLVADRLAARESSAHNQATVTKAQKQRRGDAVARAKAEKSGNAISIAIAASEWKNATRYARRCRVSQPALSRYINGTLDCPPHVADQVRADFGLGDDAWPRPPRR